MSVAQRKFTEVLDLLLVGLYHFARDLPPGHFFLVDAINRRLTEPVPAQLMREAAKVLQSRDLVQGMYPLGGRCYARITGAGRAYVEEKRGSPVIDAYRKDPASFFVDFSEPLIEPVEATKQAIGNSAKDARFREPAIQLVESIKQNLEQDRSLDDAVRSDALSDADVVFHQLFRAEPNLPAIAALLAPLADFPSVRDQVADLIDMLNG